MKATLTRSAIRWALPAVLCVSCVGPGTTYLGFTTGVTTAPPPRVVVVEQPAVVPAPGTSVYVVTDPAVPYDMFRYGTTWYLYSGHYWYRSASPRGPFAVVDVRRVPREVVTLPPGHWKHHPHAGKYRGERRGHREG